MKYGYARVSSYAQDYQAQVESLKCADCQKIYSEKASGKNTKDRPEFNRLMKIIKAGDTIVVVRLDRLARSSRDLANIMVQTKRVTRSADSGERIIPYCWL